MLSFDDAHGLDDDLYLGGFVSQGYYRTSEYDFLMENSTQGTAEFNDVGFTVMASPHDNFRIGIQLLAKDAGDIGNNDVILDWAFGDYRWKDWLGFRAGKLKMMMGIYNIAQDLDMLRTPIFLPQSVYSTAWREFTLAQEGISLYGSKELGAWGSVEYEGMGGALNVPDPENGYWNKTFSSDAAYSFSVFNTMQDTVILEFQRTERITASFPWIAGGTIVWNTPLRGFRVAASMNTGEYDMSFYTVLYKNVFDPLTGAQLDRRLESIRTDWTDRYLISAFSLEYVWRDFIFSSEVMTFEQESGSSQGLYAMLTWEPNSLYSLSCYASEFLPDVENSDGKSFEDPNRDEFTAWQREAVFSGRLNITSSWLIKAEFHAVDGIGQVLYEDAIESDSRYWTMFALRTTFHF